MPASSCTSKTFDSDADGPTIGSRVSRKSTPRTSKASAASLAVRACRAERSRPFCWRTTDRLFELLCTAAQGPFAVSPWTPGLRCASSPRIVLMQPTERITASITAPTPRSQAHSCSAVGPSIIRDQSAKSIDRSDAVNSVVRVTADAELSHATHSSLSAVSPDRITVQSAPARSSVALQQASAQSPSSGGAIPASPSTVHDWSAHSKRRCASLNSVVYFTAATEPSGSTPTSHSTHSCDRAPVQPVSTRSSASLQQLSARPPSLNNTAPRASLQAGGANPWAALRTDADADETVQDGGIIRTRSQYVDKPTAYAPSSVYDRFYAPWPVATLQNNTPKPGRIAFAFDRGSPSPGSHQTRLQLPSLQVNTAAGRPPSENRSGDKDLSTATQFEESVFSAAESVNQNTAKVPTVLKRLIQVQPLADWTSHQATYSTFSSTASTAQALQTACYVSNTHVSSAKASSTNVSRLQGPTRHPHKLSPAVTNRPYPAPVRDRLQTVDDSKTSSGALNYSHRPLRSVDTNIHSRSQSTPMEIDPTNDTYDSKGRRLRPITQVPPPPLPPPGVLAQHRPRRLVTPLTPLPAKPSKPKQVRRRTISPQKLAAIQKRYCPIVTWNRKEDTVR